MPIGVAVLVWPVQGARAHCIMGVGTFQTKQVFWTDDSSPHHAFFSFSQVGCESLGIEHGVYPAKHCGIHSKLAASQLACGHIVIMEEREPDKTAAPICARCQSRCRPAWSANFSP